MEQQDGSTFDFDPGRRGRTSRMKPSFLLVPPEKREEKGKNKENEAGSAFELLPLPCLLERKRKETW